MSQLFLSLKLAFIALAALVAPHGATHPAAKTTVVAPVPAPPPAPVATTTTQVTTDCVVQYGRVYFNDTPGYLFAYTGSCEQANTIAAEYPGSKVTQQTFPYGGPNG